MVEKIEIRKYKPQDAQALADIYYYTIHKINIRDYSQEQVNAWAPSSSLERTGWKEKWERIIPIVATYGKKIVGFTEFEPNGYIDCFFVHHQFLGKGVGSAMMKEIETKVKEKNINRIYSDVSITAKAFFEKKGLQVVKEQIVTMRGIKLKNFVMEKIFTNAPDLPKIITNHLILRLPKVKEAESMCDFVIKNKQHLSLWEPIHPDTYYTEDYWRKKIEQISNSFLSDKSCCLNIYTKEDNQLIGMVNYNNFIRGAFHSCFLGFKISKQKQGKGYISEALQASINYVFQTLNLHRIGANYMPRNKASARILEKNSFKQEGVAKDYLYINGKWEQHILTSLINKDWVKNKI